MKAGYVIPVSILTYPYVDLKHDLRFIALVRDRKDITLEEKTIPINSVFTMIVNEFGKVDCVSKECAEIMNICKKLLDHGLTLH